MIILCAYIDVVLENSVFSSLTILVELALQTDGIKVNIYLPKFWPSKTHSSQCIIWPSVTLHLHFLKQFHAGVLGRWHFFKQWRFNWVQEPRLQEEKKKKSPFLETLQNCCYQEILWIGLNFLMKYFRPKPLWIFWSFWDVHTIYFAPGKLKCVKH